MILTKREKYIAIGVGAAMAILLLDSYVLSPFVERHRKINEGMDNVTAQIARAGKLVKQEKELKPVWARITTMGLKPASSEAESQAENAVQELIRDSGLSLTAIKPDRPSVDGQFEVVGIHATATGRMGAIGKLVWALETTPIPMRIVDLVVTPQKEGTDQLQVQVTVSTLSTTAIEPDKNSPSTRANGGTP